MDHKLKLKYNKTSEYQDQPVFIENSDFSAQNKQYCSQQYDLNAVDEFFNQNKQIPTDLYLEKDSFQQFFKQMCNTTNQDQQNLLQNYICSTQFSKTQHQQQQLYNIKKQMQKHQASTNQKINSKKCKKKVLQKKSKKRIDQYIFKRRHTIIKECLKKLQLGHYIKTYKSYRKDYFILIMCLIQSQKMLLTFEEKYNQGVSSALKQIEVLLSNQTLLFQEKEHFNMAKKIIINSKQIVNLFCLGNINQAFNMIYNHQCMTRTQDYFSALINLNKERQKLGLSLLL